MVTRRSMIMGGGAAVVAAGADLAPVDGKKKKRKKNKRKTITQTFSNAASITLPGGVVTATATPYPSTIDVSGLTKGTIQKVRVFLNGYTYDVPDDIDVLLAASQLPGLNAIIMSDVGAANAVSNVDLVLDDNAANPLPDSDQLTSGTYRPANYTGSPDTWPAPAPAPSGKSALSVFNGQNPNGEWQLWINDWEGNGPGNFGGGWGIEITAQVKKKKKKKKKK
ncbi:MAG: hypothetical protein R2853_17465 [Thermomicrobiales bacterium]|nr:hypothetical protein [Thermomicrobiales bacterium]